MKYSSLDIRRRCAAISFILVLAAGCATKPEVGPSRQPAAPGKGVGKIGYAIQVGAFSKLPNAVRLSQHLQDRGLNAYYFHHKTGLYKVRFGDFPSRERARKKAENLYARGIIVDFYIVGPEDYPAWQDRKKGGIHLRDEIVITAERFIGVPYRFGGTSPQRGFDCSGLSMAVYHLNGVSLPRTSGEQWAAGSPVDQKQLSKGDLVFFATSARGRVSHVGIYVGRNQFIHAPGRGKTIRVDSLSRAYYRRRYMGGRAYL
jgi:hypothetical protein